MSMRPQTQLTFTIGLDHCQSHTDHWSRQESFKRRVADQACFIAGGCATSSNNGYWVHDGAIDQDCYAGTPMPEQAFEVKITMNQNKVNMAYEHMRYAIGEASRMFGLEIEWVHCVQQRVIGRHFSVEDDQRSEGVTAL